MSTESTGTRTVRPEVVVAVNDSASARAALSWAAGWARRTGMRLRAVHVEPIELEGPPLVYPVVPWGVNYTQRERIEVRQEREAVQNMFDALTPAPDWTLDIVTGAPGEEIINASMGAALLVIGTRRLGPLRRLAEGSVSRYCVHHADCAVLVVPANRRFEVAALRERAVVDA